MTASTCTTKSGNLPSELWRGLKLQEDVPQDWAQFLHGYFESIDDPGSARFCSLLEELKKHTSVSKDGTLQIITNMGYIKHKVGFNVLGVYVNKGEDVAKQVRYMKFPATCNGAICGTKDMEYLVNRKNFRRMGDTALLRSGHSHEKEEIELYLDTMFEHVSYGVVANPAWDFGYNLQKRSETWESQGAKAFLESMAATYGCIIITDSVKWEKILAVLVLDPIPKMQGPLGLENLVYIRNEDDRMGFPLGLATMSLLVSKDRTGAVTGGMTACMEIIERLTEDEADPAFKKLLLWIMEMEDGLSGNYDKDKEIKDKVMQRVHTEIRQIKASPELDEPCEEDECVPGAENRYATYPEVKMPRTYSLGPFPVNKNRDFTYF